MRHAICCMPVFIQMCAKVCTCNWTPQTPRNHAITKIIKKNITFSYFESGPRRQTKPLVKNDLIDISLFTIQHAASGYNFYNKKMAWKSYHEKLLNTEIAQNRNSVSQVNTVSSFSCLIDQGIVRESISKSQSICRTIRCSARNCNSNRRSRR